MTDLHRPANGLAWPSSTAGGSLRGGPALLPVLVWLMGLSCLLGMACLQLQPRLPAGRTQDWVLLSGLGLLIAGGLAWRFQRRGPPGDSPQRLQGWRWLSLCLLVLAAGLLGFGHAAWQADQRMAQRLHPAWEGRDLWVQGVVDSLPQPVQGLGGSRGWRFEFTLSGPAQEVLEREHPGLAAQTVPVPRRLLLSWYGAAQEPAPPLRAGESWRLRVRLKRVHALLNPHGFDGELLMLEQGLGASGSVRELPGHQRLQAASWAAGGTACCHVLLARQALRDALYQRVDDPTAAGVLAALSLGDQAAIERPQWSLFRDTGIAHLMSISGMHVTMLAWLMAALSAALWRCSRRLCLWVPAPMAGMWLGVASALLYAVFSGWGVPAQRTVWMLLVLALLRQAGLRWPWSCSLLLAAVLVCLLDPWALTQAGFWLSFLAVALLMGSSPESAKPPGKGLTVLIREGWHSQWVATLGLAPLSVLFFQQVSVVGVLANGLAIPLVSFLITPLALLGAVWGGFWDVGAWLVQQMLSVLQGLLQWPGAVWPMPVAPRWAQLLGLLGGVLLVLPGPWRLRLLGVGMLLPLLWAAVPRPPWGHFDLLAADVGQGNAVLLRTRHHALLYDTGPQYGPGLDAGQRVLVPLLRAIGQDRLDVLMISHRDLDHVGGAASVMAAMPVDRVMGQLEPTHPVRGLARSFSLCQRGQAWRWDGVDFEVLQPAPQDPAPSSNAQSCLLRVSDGQRSVLLAGDMEAPQEALLLQREAPTRLRADVLLVPHHGSKTSSSAEFIAAVQPRHAVMQLGYLNRFGHPALPVLARYAEAGALVRRSDHCGAWHWRSQDGQEACERDVQQRYWRWQPQDAPGAPGAPWGPHQPQPQPPSARP